MKSTAPKVYRVGLVYIGSTEIFESVKVTAYNKGEAATRGAGYLKPNHLQTITVEELIGPSLIHPSSQSIYDN